MHGAAARGTAGGAVAEGEVPGVLAQGLDFTLDAVNFRNGGQDNDG